jgi:hypothetical protein
MKGKGKNTYNSGRKAVGNKVVTGRGYKGGTEMKELIGAKKVKGKK